MILFFDTETTGLPRGGLPSDHPDQPHMVQLACLLTEEDGTERASISMIVKPGCPVPPEVAAIHGITDEIAARCGIDSPAAVALWDRLAERADTLVAHNIGFDVGIMETAWLRCRPSKPSLHQVHGSRTRFCTMRRATPVVNLPPTARMEAAGMNRPKAPRLAECVQHFFGEPLDGAHDAMIDVRACARVFFHLRSLEVAA